MGTQLRIELLGEHPELLDIAIADIKDEQMTSWVRGGDGVIGFGVYKSHIVKGPNRFEQARSWWRSEISTLDIANNAIVQAVDQFSSPLFHLMKQKIPF